MRKPHRALVWLIAMLLVLAACPLSAGAASVPQENSSKVLFKDLANTDSAYPYVQYLAGKGIITGYSDGTYHPNSGLTRAEAATVICKAMGLAAQPSTTSVFKDVSNSHWAKGYISEAVKAGYIKGNPDKTFRPEQKLTRAEAITLLFRLSKSDISQATLPALTDINDKHWAAKPIAAALAAGMVGLSSDGKKFMPEAPFTRLNLAQALGILMTRDPSLYKIALPGTLTSLAGTIVLKKSGSEKETTVTQTITIGAGDTVISVKGAKAEISYPDGSSLLIKDDTQVIIKSAEGRKYIKTDGSEGIAVDWLNVDLKQGTLLGALATRHDSSETTNSTTSYNPARFMAALASLNQGNNLLGTLVAAAPKAQPWYVAAQTKKVKVQVDMPWGVAAIRGTFWQNFVTAGGQSNTACLEGSVSVTSAGQTVSLAQNQATQIISQMAPPPPPAPMSQQQVQQFAQEQQWVQQTAQTMDQQQEAAAPPPPAPAPVEVPYVPPTPASNPVTTPPASTSNIINQALSSVGVTSGNTQTQPTPTPTHSSNNNTDRSGATASVSFTSVPQCTLVTISNATNFSGSYLSGNISVNVTLDADTSKPLYSGNITFTNGTGHVFIPNAYLKVSPGSHSIGVAVTGITAGKISAVIFDIPYPWTSVGSFGSTPVHDVSISGNYPVVSYIDSGNNTNVMKYAYQTNTWDNIDSSNSLPENQQYLETVDYSSDIFAMCKSGIDSHVYQYNSGTGQWNSSYVIPSTASLAELNTCDDVPMMAYIDSGVLDILKYDYALSTPAWVSSQVISPLTDVTDFTLYAADSTHQYCGVLTTDDTLRVYQFSSPSSWQQVGGSVYIGTGTINDFVLGYSLVSGTGTVYAAIGYTENNVNYIKVVKCTGSIWEPLGPPIIGEDMEFSAYGGVPTLAYVDQNDSMNVVVYDTVSSTWKGIPVHAGSGDSDTALAYIGYPYLAFSDGARGGALSVMKQYYNLNVAPNYAYLDFAESIPLLFISAAGMTTADTIDTAKFSFNMLASADNQVITSVNLSLPTCAQAGTISDLQSANHYFIEEYPDTPEDNCIVISLTQEQAATLSTAFSSNQVIFIMGSSGWGTIQSSPAPELFRVLVIPT